MVRNSSVLFLVLFVVGVLAQTHERLSLYKGNQSFEEKDFDRASYHYLNAIKENSQDYKGNYNLGNTLYRQNRYQDAVTAYEKALKNASTSEEKKSVLYNLGNAHFRNHQFQKAVDAYQKALSITPNDPKTAENLKIAQRKLKEQQEKQKPKSPNAEDSKPSDNSSSSSDKKNQENDGNPQDKKGENDFSPKEKHGRKRTEKEEKLLDYIQQKEMNTAKRAMGNRGYAQPKSNQKDW